MFVKLINMHTPILDFLYIPISLGVQIRKGENMALGKLYQSLL